jgi:hypothetical protein
MSDGKSEIPLTCQNWWESRPMCEALACVQREQAEGVDLARQYRGAAWLAYQRAGLRMIEGNWTAALVDMGNAICCLRLAEKTRG